MAVKRVWHPNDPRNPAGTGGNVDPNFTSFSAAQTAATSGDTILWYGSTDASGAPRIFYESPTVSKTLTIDIRGAVIRPLGTNRMISFTADNTIMKGRGTWDGGSGTLTGEAVSYGSKVLEIIGQAFIGGLATSGYGHYNAGNTIFRRCIFDGLSYPSAALFIGAMGHKLINCYIRNCSSIGGINAATIFCDTLMKSVTSWGTAAGTMIRVLKQGVPAFPGGMTVTDSGDGTITFVNEAAMNFYPAAGSTMMTSTGQMGADSTGTNGRGMGAANTGLRGPYALYVASTRKYRIVNAADLSDTAGFAGSTATWDGSLFRWTKDAAGNGTVTDGSNAGKGQDLGANAITHYVEAFGDETNNATANQSAVVDKVETDFEKQFDFDAHDTAPTPAQVTMGAALSNAGRYAKSVFTLRGDVI